MDNMLLGAGLACVIAAIIGGGLKAFGLEIPALASLRRQLALGLVGVLLLGVVYLRSRDVSSPLTVVPRSTPPNASLDPKQPADTPDSKPPVVPQQSGTIALNVNTFPTIVAPGGSTTITVLATAPDGTPVIDAQITVSAGGGSFEPTGATKALGHTDAQGVFHAVWHTYQAAAYTGDMSYGFGVEASKAGMTQGTGEASVQIRK